jgi:hypothetical protein
MLRLLLFALLLVATIARAQSPAASLDDWELGLRYWFSSGTTQWSHNAQGLDARNGNPTSILTYENLTAHSVELHARKNLDDRWFIRGNAGVGWIRHGSLDDEDYEAGQVKILDSTSSVRGDSLTYATIDLGRDLWARGGTTFGLFVGYHWWSERLDAYGVTFTVNTKGLANADESVLAISNEATWGSLRLGVTVNSAITPKTRFCVDLAWLPYASLYNEDSHWLRRDLGPAPNVFIDGRGHGFQLDLEMRHVFSSNWEAGAGFRHWWLRATKGDVSTITFSAPLVEFKSQRTGVTLSLTRRW